MLASVEHPSLPGSLARLQRSTDVQGAGEARLAFAGEPQRGGIRQKLFGGGMVDLIPRADHSKSKKREIEGKGDSELEKEQVRLSRNEQQEHPAPRKPEHCSVLKAVSKC